MSATLPKVMGCLLCGYRTDKPKEIMFFQLNGCPCQAKECTDAECGCSQL